MELDEAFLQRTPDGVILSHPDGTIARANPAACRMVGRPEGELLGLAVRELFVPGAGPDAVLGSCERSGAGRGESALRGADGSTIPVEVDAARIPTADGPRLFLHLRDLTERKRAEAALIDARESLELAVEAASIGTWHAVPFGPLHWSDRCKEIFGVPSDYVPQTFEEFLRLVHPDDHESLKRALLRSLDPEGDGAYEDLYRCVRPDGTVRWVSAHGKTRFAEVDGVRQAVRFAGTTVDVTERVVAEQQLRRLAAAVEQTPASIVITDPAGTVEYVNPAYEQTTGYSAAEAVGRNAGLVKSGQHGPDFYRQLWETIGAGRVWTGRFVNRNRSGELFTEDAVIAPVKDSAGVIRNYVAVKRDVTRELRVERQLAESRRLESVARLAGGIAHDFNNLLTVVLSCVEALKTDLRATGTADLEDVEEIRAAGERARDLTRKLLAFARRQVIEPVSLDLNVLVREAEKLLRRLLHEDIAMELDLAPGLWSVRCDPAQMDQLLLNLAVNARDAMPDGGKLRIATSNVVLDQAEAARLPEARPGQYVRLAVSDSGVGMAPDVQAHLFEPFFTTKPLGQGTGLGLATVHGIVTQSGGLVRVESTPGAGTTFEVFLPRAEAEDPQTAPPPAAALPATGRETILVVEDDPAVRAVTIRSLRSGGYQVLSAENGVAAMELLSSHRGRIDLLLSDVVMPGVNGRQLADEVRRHWPVARVLFVSGHAHDVLAARGVLEPGVHLLRKPHTGAVLLARVRQVLDAT
jgi:PAS domain S-box-containing protein